MLTLKTPPAAPGLPEISAWASRRYARTTSRTSVKSRRVVRVPGDDLELRDPGATTLGGLGGQRGQQEDRQLTGPRMAERPGADDLQAIGLGVELGEHLARDLGDRVGVGRARGQILGRGQHARVAVDLARAHPHHRRPAGEVAQGLQHPDGDGVVVTEGLRRGLPGAAHRGERRQVVDELRSGRAHRRRHRVPVAHVDRDALSRTPRAPARDATAPPPRRPPRRTAGTATCRRSRTRR